MTSLDIDLARDPACLKDLIILLFVSADAAEADSDNLAQRGTAIMGRSPTYTDSQVMGL